MGDIITALKDTPVPTILIVGGIGFLLLAVAGSIAGKIEIPPARQKWAGGIGVVLLSVGLILYMLPIPRSTGTFAPTAVPAGIPIPTETLAIASAVPTAIPL